MVDEPEIPRADARAMALVHALRGHRVLRLPPDSKESKLTHDKASREASAVERMFTDWEGKPEEGNIAIMTGDGFMALDIDKKDGDVGERLADIEGRFGKLPLTQIVETPNGGLHFYFKVPKGIYVSGRVGKLAPCVDIRGDGNYVVAPGSTINGVAYRWREGSSPEERDIADCPPRLLEAVQSVRPRRINSAGGKPKIAGEVDTPPAISRATKYLKSGAPEAVEGSGGRKATMSVAHAVMDIGCSPETTAALMGEHGDERNSPPWGDEKLLSLVLSLVRSRQEPLGSRAVENAFEPVEIAAGSDAPAAPKKRYITADEAERLALESSGEYLVKGWLDRGTLSVRLTE